MKKHTITDSMSSWAEIEGPKIGVLKNSYMQGTRNVHAKAGETVVKVHMEGVSPDAESFEHDCFVEGVGKVETKTKVSNFTPQPNYLCSVAVANCTQDCDAYAFVRVTEDMSCGWFLGWLPKEEFFAKCFRLEEGDLDPDSAHGFTVKFACYNVPISELRDWPEVKGGDSQKYAEKYVAKPPQQRELL